MLDFEIDHTIARIKNGERNGFVVFFNQTFQFMFTRAKYLFPNNIENKHFLTASYHNIFMSIHDFSPALNLETWLTSKILLTYNQILKENQIDAFADLSNLNTPPSLSLSPSIASMEFLKEKSADLLSNDILKLPALPKIIALAFYHDGLHSSQIADALDCPEIYISWELGKTKEFLESRYLQHGANQASDLYPFSLPLIYSAFEKANSKFSVTKEYASIVWENVSADLIFRKTRKKKALTLPIFFGFSILLLAFILIKMFGDGSFGGGSSHAKLSHAQNIEGDTSSLLPSKPKTTTTVKDANGTVKTYDENGSEISTADSSKSSTQSTEKKTSNTSGTNSTKSSSLNSNANNYASGAGTTKDTSGSNGNNSSSNSNTSNGSNSSSSSSNSNGNNSSSSSSNSNGNNRSSGSDNSTKNAASDNSKAASHTVTAPSITTPSVHTPSVSAPSVNTPSVSAPSTPTP